MDPQLGRRPFFQRIAAVLAGGLIALRLRPSEPTYELLISCYNANTGEETFEWKQRELADFRRLTNPGRITYPHGEFRIGRRAFQMIEPPATLPPGYLSFRDANTTLDQAFNEEITKVLQA